MTYGNSLCQFCANLPVGCIIMNVEMSTIKTTSLLINRDLKRQTCPVHEVYEKKKLSVSQLLIYDMACAMGFSPDFPWYVNFQIAKSQEFRKEGCFWCQ